MSKTAYFLLKTSIYEDHDIADVVKDIEQTSEAECIDYMWLDNLEETDLSPYIAY